MTNLIQRLWTQLSGFLHDLLDRTSDTGRNARHALRAMERQVAQAEESVTDVAAELTLMKHEQTKAEQAAEKWGVVATEAARRGDRNAAIEAVQLQVQADELGASYSAHVARLTPSLEALKSRLTALRQQRLEMQHKAAVLGARSQVAQAQAQAARHLGRIGQHDGVDFKAIERGVDRQEAKTAALLVMAQDKTAQDADLRLAADARRSAVATKLQSLGLEPPASCPPLQLVNGSEVGHAD